LDIVREPCLGIFRGGSYGDDGRGWQDSPFSGTELWGVVEDMGRGDTIGEPAGGVAGIYYDEGSISMPPAGGEGVPEVVIGEPGTCVLGIRIIGEEGFVVVVGFILVGVPELEAVAEPDPDDGAVIGDKFSEFTFELGGSDVEGRGLDLPPDGLEGFIPEAGRILHGDRGEVKVAWFGGQGAAGDQGTYFHVASPCRIVAYDIGIANLPGYDSGLCEFPAIEALLAGLPLRGHPDIHPKGVIAGSLAVVRGGSAVTDTPEAS